MRRSALTWLCGVGTAHSSGRSLSYLPACLPAGAYHFVENISSGTTKFLQIFDHPQGGAVFAAPALVALRNAGGNAAAIVNSAFSSNVLGAGVTAKGAIINVAGCNW